MQLPILPEIFQIATINRLMNIVGMLAARQGEAGSTVSTSSVPQKRWQDWELIAKALSLDEEKLLVCLGAPAKALLFWMHSGLQSQPQVQYQVKS